MQFGARKREGKVSNEIHPTAIIHSDAQIGENVRIGPYVVIEGPVVVKDRVRIIAHAYVSGWTTVEEDCVIHPFAVIGDEPQDRAHKGDRSYCHIGPRTVIREGVTVHRGTKAESETRIGADCMLMVNSHVGHNCTLGDHVTLTNGVLLAGHVTLGHHVMAGGGAMVHQFVEVGEYAMLGGASESTQNVAPFMTVTGRNRCIGLNQIGLRRNGVPKEDIAELKTIYRKVFKAATQMREQARALEGSVSTESGKRLIQFILSCNSRGIVKPAATGRTESADLSAAK